MAAKTIISQLLKLRAKKKTIDKFLSSGAGKKTGKDLATRVEKEKQSKLLKKSIDRLEKQTAAAKTISKDPASQMKSLQNRKKRSPDGSKVIGLSGQDAQMVRFGNYAGIDKEMIRLREAIKTAEAKPNLSTKAKEELKLQKNKYKRMVDQYGKPSDEKKSGGAIVKKPMGGKVYKNTVYKKHGGAIGVGAALRGFGKGYKKG